MWRWFQLQKLPEASDLFWGYFRIVFFFQKWRWRELWAFLRADDHQPDEAGEGQWSTDRQTEDSWRWIIRMFVRAKVNLHQLLFFFSIKCHKTEEEHDVPGPTCYRRLAQFPKWNQTPVGVDQTFIVSDLLEDVGRKKRSSHPSLSCVTVQCVYGRVPTVVL